MQKQAEKNVKKIQQQKNTALISVSILRINNNKQRSQVIEN